MRRGSFFLSFLEHIKYEISTTYSQRNFISEVRDGEENEEEEEASRQTLGGWENETKTRQDELCWVQMKK